jgi:acyl-CoA dehydrogenase
MSTLRSPGFTLRGGTREILRGVIARGLGLR